MYLLSWKQSKSSIKEKKKVSFDFDDHASFIGKASDLLAGIFIIVPTLFGENFPLSYYHSRAKTLQSVV